MKIEIETKYAIDDVLFRFCNKGIIPCKIEEIQTKTKIESGVKSRHLILNQESQIMYKFTCNQLYTDEEKIKEPVFFEDKQSLVNWLLESAKNITEEL